MKLSRVGGFTYNGTSVDNSNDIYLLNVVRDITPNLLYSNVIVPKRHGSMKYENRLEDRQIEVDIGIYATNPTARRRKVRELLKHFEIGTEGKLVFHDESTVYHLATIYKKVEAKETEVFTELKITFTCKPLKYVFDNDTGELSVRTPGVIEGISGTMEVKGSFTGVGTQTIGRLNNLGNYEATPIIKLSGSASNVSIQIGNMAFSITNLLSNQEVYVDTERMVCYYFDGTRNRSKLADFYGVFPVIKPGFNDIVIDGRNLVNVGVDVAYHHTLII